MRKMKTGSRLVSLLLAVLMLIAYMPLLGEAVYAEDGVAIITLDKAEYTEGESINVTCDLNGYTPSSSAWITVIKSNSNIDASALIWYYPEKYSSNTVDIIKGIGTDSSIGEKRADLTPGEYKVLYVYDPGNAQAFQAVSNIATFKVVGEPAATISTDKAEYSILETVKVTCATKDSSGGWVAVFPGSTTSYSGGSTLWYYPYDPNGGAHQSSAGTPDGTAQSCDLIPDVGYLAPGEWQVVYLDGSRNPLSEPARFTIKAPNDMISLDTRRHKVNDDAVTVTLNSEFAEKFLTVCPDGWIGLYDHPDNTGGVDLGVAFENCYAYKYVKDFVDDKETNILNADAGEKSFNKTIPGKYRVVLFSGGYDVITNNIKTFTVEHSFTAPEKFDWYPDEETEEWKASATFAAVDDETVTKEVDAVVTSESTDATCKAAGETKYTATIETVDFLTETEAPFTDTKTVEIPKKEHTEEVIPAVPATCTEKGLTEGKKCSVCGEILVAQEEVPALGHKEETVAAKEATCTEKGLTEGKKCSVCGETLVAQEEVPALGHNMTAHEAKEATREAEGNKAYWSCDRCSKFFEDAEGKTEIAEGDWVLPKLEPTPEEKAAKEELNKAVDDAKKVEQGNYTDESFKALQDAIAEAEALAKDENATKAQLDAAAAKIADAKAALKDKEPEVGTEVPYSGNTYKVTSVPGAAVKTVAFTKAKNSKTVTVPSTMKINGETYKVTSVAAKAFKGSKCTTAYIGANVKKLDKYAFRYSKVKTVYIKSKSLSKTRVKGSLKYSKVTTIKAKVSTKKSTNKSYAKKFKSYFTKANAGKKVTVKY